MKNLLLYIWQLPQNILGYAVSRGWKNKLKLISEAELNHIRRIEEFLHVKIYIVTQESKKAHPFFKWISGFGCGVYICLTDAHDLDTVRHENGHVKQSMWLGPLFLPVVGIYSAVFCNLWDRWFHKEWCYYDCCYWYYKTRWTEKAADKAGGVNRDTWLNKIPRPDNARYPKLKMP